MMKTTLIRTLIACKLLLFLAIEAQASYTINCRSAHNTLNVVLKDAENGPGRIVADIKLTPIGFMNQISHFGLNLTNQEILERRVPAAPLHFSFFEYTASNSVNFVNRSDIQYDLQVTIVPSDDGEYVLERFIFNTNARDIGPFIPFNQNHCTVTE